MDKSYVQNSWKQASNDLNNLWAINLYEENEINDKTVLEADGIIYSPVDDKLRPYPIFTLDFTLFWSVEDGFRMKFHFPHTDKKLNFTDDDKLFRSVEESNGKKVYYLNFRDSNQKNVSSYLNDVNNFLFPKYNESKPKDIVSRIRNWLIIIPNFYSNK